MIPEGHRRFIKEVLFRSSWHPLLLHADSADFTTTD